MPNWKPLYIAVLVLILALLKADVAEGYFLSSTQTRSGTSLVSGPASASFLNGPSKGDSWFPGESKADVEASHSKYPIIEACHLRLQMVFGKYTQFWWEDWKLWVGLTFWLAVWVKWLLHGYDEVYYQRALFAFGINIVILHHLQYADTIMRGMLGVCVLLAGQSLFQSAVWFHAEPHADDDDDFVCDTLYLDLGLPAEQVIVLFIAQFGVWWFYMTSIIGNLDFADVNYLFWVWAYLVMQMTMIFNRGGDSVLGNAFPCADVQWIIRVADKSSWHLVSENGEKGVTFQIGRADIIMRGLMGFFCNSVLREIMAYTIPLMLMGFSEPMDFVVYCVGVNFICTLDDMSERTYEMTSFTPQLELDTAQLDPEQADVKTMQYIPQSDEPKPSPGEPARPPAGDAVTVQNTTAQAENATAE